MPTDLSKKVGQGYRGFGIKHPEWKSSNFRRTDSTMTEANPYPGVPKASQKTGLVIETSGKMENTNLSTPPALTIQTSKGGMPGMQDARFWFTPNYSRPSWATDTPLGWDSPNAISQVEIVDYEAGNDYIGDCICLQSNTVLLCAIVNGSVKVLTKRFDISSYLSSGTVKWDPWSIVSTNAFNQTNYLSTPLRAGIMAFVQLPEGRVHLYLVVKDTTTTGQEFYQVAMVWSDDDGEHWSDPNYFCLRDQIAAHGTYGGGGGTDTGFDIHRIRAAYNNGEVILMMTGVIHQTSVYTITNATWQFASSDMGHSFDQVDIGFNSLTDGALTTSTAIYPTGSSHSAANIDITTCVDGSGFIISYNQCVSTAGQVGRPKIKKLGSAYTNWLEVDPVDVNGSTVDYGVITNQYLQSTNTTIASDENGIITIAVTKKSAGEVWSFVSFDFGVSWTDYRCDLARGNPANGFPWWKSGDPNFYPADSYCSTYQCGRWIIITPFNVGDGQEDESAIPDNTKIWELDLGGYTALTRPFKDSEEKDNQQVMWEREWVAAQRLQDTLNWVAGGAGTETLNVGGWSDFVTGAGQTITRDNLYFTAPATTEFREIVAVEFKVTAGTARAQLLINYNGLANFEIWLEQTSTTYTIWDNNGAAALATGALPNPGGFHTFYYAMSDFALTNGRTCVGLRDSNSDREVRMWLQQGTLNPTSVAVPVVGRIRLQQDENTTSQWRYAAWGSGSYGRPPMYTSISSDWTTILYGRTISPFPVHVYSGDGVRVRGIDGPTWMEDKFTITQRHEYEFENVFPDVLASPRKTWRSLLDNAQQDIVVRVAGTSAVSEPWLGRVIFIAAFNCNFQKMTVSYRGPGGGAWTALGTLDFSTGMTGLKWESDGKIIRPNTAAGATSASEYFTYNQLEDSHFSKNGSTGPIYQILTNAEGAWKDTTSVRTRLHVSKDAGAAGGAEGEIWSKDGALIIHDAPDIYELQFTIPACQTAENYLEIGTLLVGHVAYFGKQYARGRALGFTPNYDLTTGRGGARRAQVYGPTRRSVEFGWANENETDTSQLYAATPDPDYILPNTGSINPVATPADTSYKMAGLVDYLRGAGECTVYFSRLSMVAAGTTDQTLVNRNLFMLGRVTSEPRIETVLGSEGEGSGAGELVRIATVTFEEEV